MRNLDLLQNAAHFITQKVLVLVLVLLLVLVLV